MPSRLRFVLAALIFTNLVPSGLRAADARQLEAQMVTLLNRDRASNGLPALRSDPALADVARAHSLDMVQSGNFSHQSRTTGSPDQRIDRAGISWNAFAENIAFNADVATAQASLMRSPGHRANILNGTYDTLGIGIVPSGRQIYVTQVFIKGAATYARHSASRLSGATAAVVGAQSVPTRTAPRTTKTKRVFRLFGR